MISWTKAEGSDCWKSDIKQIKEKENKSWSTFKNQISRLQVAKRLEAQICLIELISKVFWWSKTQSRKRWRAEIANVPCRQWNNRLLAVKSQAFQITQTQVSSWQQWETQGKASEIRTSLDLQILGLLKGRSLSSSCLMLSLRLIWRLLTLTRLILTSLTKWDDQKWINSKLF